MPRTLRLHRATLALQILVAGGGLVGAVLTYDPIADGARRWYFASLLVAGGLAFLAAGVLMDQRLPIGAPLTAGTAILILGAIGPHLIRLAAPAMRHQPEITVAHGAAGESRWLSTTTGPGEIRRVSDVWELRAPPGGAAYLALDGRDVERDYLVRRDSLRRLGLVPIARSRYETDELLRWRARYVLQSAYLTVLETNGLLLQLTDAGLLVQTRVDARGPFRDAGFVSGGARTWAAVREFEVARGPTGTTLAIDGTAAWQGPREPALGLMRLGEARPATDHSGDVTLLDAVYERRLAADRAPLSSTNPFTDGSPHVAPLAVSAAALTLVATVRRRMVAATG